MGTGPGDLNAMAQEWLAVCSAALATTPGGAPTRAFISPGPPAWDCANQLSIHIGGPAAADTYPLMPVLQPGHRIAILSQLDLITLTATILRCAPLPDQRGNPPTVSQIDAVAVIVNADLWAIWNFTRFGKATNTLFGPKERELFMEPAVALNQMGGISGWQFSIRVQLDGYRPS